MDWNAVCLLNTAKVNDLAIFYFREPIILSTHIFLRFENWWTNWRFENVSKMYLQLCIAKWSLLFSYNDMWGHIWPGNIPSMMLDGEL